MLLDLKLLNQLNGYKDEVIKLNAQLAVNENVTEINAEIKVKKELIEKIRKCLLVSLALTVIPKYGKLPSR